MSEIIPPKTEKKIFKGTEINMGSIAHENGIPVHFVEPIKPINQWNRPAKLPRLAVITSAKPMEGDAYKRLYVTYRTPKGTVGQAYFPSEYVMRKLTGTVGQSMIAKHEANYIANLAHNLYYTGYIGSDPEIFVECAKGLLPAFEFLGSKKEHTPTFQSGRGGTRKIGAYWDGFQAEFETHEQTCLAFQVDSVQDGLKTVYTAAKKYDPTAKLSNATVFEVPLEVLQSGKEEHVEFGCMPSKNAYGLKGMAMPARQLTSRSAGGHIHFGIGARPEEKMNTIVKALDAILGVSCVSLFANFDNPVRRNFYGLPGEYRTPAHGLEYRTLSNAWLIHPFLMNIVFDLSRKCVALGENNMLKYFKGDEKETIEVIKSCNVEQARVIMDRNKELILSMLKACGGGYSEGADLVFNVYRNGLESAIADPSDFVKNWNLNGVWQTHSDGLNKNMWRSADALRNGKKI